ncbi:(R)-hydratase [Meridianimarinicoccus roseus]|uniref:(R)-hydratase n=1 Tax=Meridianimarinicoccus roseus TaxID=2072018 RepID=A0A2V2LHJ6_9RHOB|nr:MaoC family dehydratase [Meridianimarinicoccus roseus]PWR01869.1 (R)-hydratase [Meridianimarinicoccus roseus]
MSEDKIGTVFLEDLEVGMSRSLTKVIDDTTVRAFAEVSEDRNPIHLDDMAGAASIFGQRIAHGMLVGSLFSALLGERLPGHGTIYLGQNLKFLAPVPLGAEVTATVTVAEIIAEKKRVSFQCEARIGEKIVVRGDATVLAPTRG